MSPGGALLLSVVASACAGSTKSQPSPATTQASTQPEPGPSPLAAEAVAGVSDPRLADLLRDHWDWVMRTAPTWATTLGDRRFDDRLADTSAQAVEEARAYRRELLGRAAAIDRDALTRQDQITLSLFIEELEADLASESCDFHLWAVSAGGNPITAYNYLPEGHKVRSAEDAANLLARYRQVPERIDAVIANLRHGLEAGKVANRESVQRTIELADGQLAKPLEEWVLLDPAQAERPDWDPELRARLAAELERAVEEGIAPAYRRYRDVLANEVLPRARRADQAGLHGLPGGEECYRARIRSYIALPKSAAELHELGLAEIRRINAEMIELGQRLFGTRELPAILDRLRTDPKLFYASRDEMLADARAAVELARQAIPHWFGILPKEDVVVVPVPDYEAPFTTIAYYRQPHFDGSKPGEYFINTYKPETRPRYEMRVLTYHESIPGHHLQIAISQERNEIPAVRRFGGNTAFVEGWALYTERLSEEMGLYESDLDRMGMLSYDAWRASRLVVDTGLHAMGWTRERAEQFMRDHTALALNNVSNEVDRYLSTPGQALAYKVGQLELLRLRAWARDQLGERFDIKGFHDAVLANGAVTLPVLEEQVRAWVEGAN